MNPSDQSRPPLWTSLAAGLFAGLLAGVAMLALMAFLRLFFGVATPTETIFDRVFPFLTVKFFIGSLVRAGGYPQLKLDGVYGALAGQLATAAFGGVIYALFLTRWTKPRPAGASSRWLDPRGWRLIVPGVLVVWAVVVALLWPQLLTNYRGFPPAQADVITTLGFLASFALCGVAIMFFYGLLTRPTTLNLPDGTKSGLTRRRFLAVGIGALSTLGLAAMLRRLYQIGTFHYDGTQYNGPGVQKIAPNDQFYQVTKNLVDPDVARDVWRFNIDGNVEQPTTWTFHELAALPAVEQETTLQCISYGVGSGLISNARWKGVPLPTLLAVAKPKADCGGVLFHAADGFFETIPLAKLQEPTTLIAYEMNGAPLPAHHGFPMRLIVPGIYGERNPKWVTRLEFIQKDDPRLRINRHGVEGVGFYTEQGWGPNVYVPTMSRIDAPAHGFAFDKPLVVGQPVEFRGIAFGGDKGISKVEVSTDGGKTYQPADIDQPGTLISWSLWRYVWTPTAPAPEINVYVRAVNGRGEPQIETFRDQVPHGATGLHWVRGKVVEATDKEAQASKVAVADSQPAPVNPRAALCHRGIWNG